MIAGNPITLSSTVTVWRAASQKSSHFRAGSSVYEVMSAIFSEVAMLPAHDP